jgi:phosphomannomutase
LFPRILFDKIAYTTWKEEVMNIAQALPLAEQGILHYLDEALQAGRIDGQLYQIARDNTYSALEKWLNDPKIDELSPAAKPAILAAIAAQRWEDVVNAFRQEVRFGTGGIRGMMAFDRDSIVRMKQDGLDAPILKGSNTINNIVILKTSAAVAKFGKDKGLEKIVLGYDSRVRGFDFAAAAAQVFLHYGYTVYFFDAPCPYPEVTYAIPALKADMGILISASHNDYRYNGYKLSCANGSQFDPIERDVIYEQYVKSATTADIHLCPFDQAADGKLFFLGGETPEENFDYAGKEQNLINMHARHLDHIKTFLLTENLAAQQETKPLEIGYCAFHGAGNVAVPRLLKETGYKRIWTITKNGLNECDGLFPQFEYRAGLEQQPDPGDMRAAHIAVESFKDDHPNKFDDLDILIGTDPDADRCGVVVRVPEEQRFLYEGREWTLLSADDLWTLVLWYRMQRQSDAAENKFVTLSHTTSDSVTRIAQQNGIGVVKTWVGFANLAAATAEIWNGHYRDYTEVVDGRHLPDSAKGKDLGNLCDPVIFQCYGMDNGKRSVNIAAMEQSNGFSILGGPPPDDRSLGQGGHVRDKDGTFAAFLVAEIAAWAKEQGTTLYRLIDEKIYPEVGLFVAGYQADPMDGEYPGIEGDRLKKAILRRALGLLQEALAGDLEFAGLPVKSACVYRTGKYDGIYPPTSDFEFPDEGLRFFFDDEKLSHLTIRPSGTGNSLRFHTQLYREKEQLGDLVKSKYELHFLTRQLFKDLRDKLKAPEWLLFLK